MRSAFQFGRCIFSCTYQFPFFQVPWSFQYSIYSSALRTLHRSSPGLIRLSLVSRGTRRFCVFYYPDDWLLVAGSVDILCSHCGQYGKVRLCSTEGSILSGSNFGNSISSRSTSGTLDFSSFAVQEDDEGDIVAALA